MIKRNLNFNEEWIESISLDEFKAHCEENIGLYGMNDIDSEGYYNKVHSAKIAREEKELAAKEKTIVEKKDHSMMPLQNYDIERNEGETAGDSDMMPLQNYDIERNEGETASASREDAGDSEADHHGE